MRWLHREIPRGWMIASLAVFAFFASEGAAEASKKEEFEFMTRPPMPVGTAAAVYLGESAEIPLEVRGRVEKPLKILIRTSPRHGRLGEVRILPDGRSGLVRYTPGANARVGTDSFTFAAQSSDSAVSAPAQVDISLKARPARLEYSKEVDFGEVALGDEVVRSIWIRNSGAEDAALDFQAPSPWSAGENGATSIKGGARREIPIRFHPQAEGDFRGRISLSADGKDYLSVRGTAFGPLEWNSSGLVFSSANRSTGRAAAVFKNRSHQERVIDFEWPGFLRGPRTVHIGPNSETEVEADLDAKPDFAFTGSVGFRSGGFSGRMPLTIESAPAHLVLEPAETLELAPVASGETAEGKITLENTGGQTIKVRLSPEGALELEPEVESFALQAGERREFEVRRILPEAGAFSERLAVEIDSAPALELKILSKARAGRPVEDLLAIPPASGAERQKADLPPVSVFTGARLEEGVLELKWKKPSAEVDSFLVEERGLGAGEGQFSWKPAEGVVVKTSGEEATARFLRLRPGVQTCIRIVPLDVEGRAGEPSRLIEVGLPPEAGSGGWPWILVAAGAGLALGGWWLAGKTLRARLRFQKRTPTDSQHDS